MTAKKQKLSTAWSRLVGGAVRWLPAVGGDAALVGCDGRPFRLDGQRCEADTVRTSAWRVPLDVDPSGCSAVLRNQLREHWLRAAAAEHASIASFARLAQQLLAVGAPPELIARAQRASLDEVRHARLCYSLASVYAGEDLGPAAFPVACVPERRAQWTREELLERLAVESLTDGCLNEGYAGAVMAAVADRAQHPALAKAAATIAVDERDHAELAWAVLAWSSEQAQGALDQRLFAEAERPAQPCAEHHPRALAQQERDHGLLTRDERDALLARTHRAVRRRLAGLLVPRRARAG